MASYEVRLSIAEIEGDDTPEVIVEFWNSELPNQRPDKKKSNAEQPDKEQSAKKGDTEFTAFVTAPAKGAPYDTVKSKADVDGNQKTDAADDEILLELVNAFMKMDLSIKS
ncbi:hypothetical protein V2K64_18605 [Pseudomonas alliivorans]|uniref:hypothetical protein n=1 Tax=Pseudomonas TaxID=286 RepID=UPI000C06A5E5|nr:MULTISPECIES: hypothetical protein [Pseudomonas]MBP0939984.1 hypothetical protein [Pseudomonas alliivorans]MCO5367702.1 hypothetical protein [Pseudomonas alliivorans]MEE4306275.1 hypothetical protein [Pseudomonas alliivorans]MEE4374408.1 hypothetical protein [Pseudomonas alliivorans]MEE4618016.1 hypothetical protein [Pseudomonas alliivorans]